jgi:hypothetical protein
MIETKRESKTTRRISYYLMGFMIFTGRAEPGNGRVLNLWKPACGTRSWSFFQTAMGAGSGNNNANNAEQCASSAASSQPRAPQSQLISTTTPATRASRYRGDIGLRGSFSVPTFATYWKVASEESSSQTVADPATTGGSSSLPVVIRDGPPKFSKAPKPGTINKGGGGGYVYPGSPPSSPRWWPKGVTFAALAGLAVLLLYLGFLIGTLFLQQEALQFAIVLDGGSTSTRVHVYGWAHSLNEPLPVMVNPTYEDNMNAPPLHGQQRLYKRVEKEPGLDKLFHNATAIKDVLVPLLNFAGKQIPKYAHRNTQVFLLATAGLRRLPKEQSDWILDESWLVLKKFPFVCRRSSVKVIKGVEEAFYGWIALNYNSGRLGHIPKLPTFGALDLGGSSLQVTFESTEILEQGDHGVNLTVGFTNHHLYAMSHPGFGLNDAFEKSVAQLLLQELGTKNRKAADNHIEVKHPCLQEGYSQPYLCSTHCMLPPLSGRGPAPISPSTDISSSAQVMLKGAPNSVACRALADEVINHSHNGTCKVTPCALGKHQPLPQGTLYGLAGFFVVYKFFGLSADASLNELLQKGEEFCKLPWKVAEASVEPQPSIHHYCFRAPYVVSLLRQGLHLNDDQVVIGSGDFAWTLGAALWEAGALTYNNVRTGGWASLTNFHVALALGVVLLLLVMLISVSLFQHRQTQLRRRGYLPLFNPSQSSSKWIPLLLRQQSRLSSSPTSGALAHGEHLVSSLSTCAGCSFCWMSFHSAFPVLYLTILAGNLLSLFTKLEIVTLALHI